MQTVFVFVEGIADQVFIADVIKKHFNINFQKEWKANSSVFFSEKIKIIETGGWGKLSNLTNIDYFALENPNGNNLIIFDADANCSTREKEITESLNQQEIYNFDIFLFPNHANPGIMEDLLIDLLEPKKSDAFFSCFNEMEKCLSEIKNFGELTVPNKKDKIYSFLSTFLSNSKSQQKKS